MDLRGNTLRKDERLSGKKSIATLLADGRWGVYGCLKYCWMPRTCDAGVAGTAAPENCGPASGKGAGSVQELPSRLLVSVPKRLFKRAVKRNLLKRRIREAWRIQKPSGIDILLQFNDSEVADYTAILEAVTGIIERISRG